MYTRLDSDLFLVQLPHNHAEAAELNQNKNSTTVIGQFQTANDPVGSSVGLVASPYGNASQCQRVAITNFVGRKDRFFLSSHPVTYAIRGSYRDCSARRAPKVTVTRGRVSLCQKGVTWWLLFLVNCLWVRKPAKTSRGASFELLARAPLRSKTDALPWRGDRGEVGWAELFTMAAALR